MGGVVGATGRPTPRIRDEHIGAAVVARLDDAGGGHAWRGGSADAWKAEGAADSGGAARGRQTAAPKAIGGWVDCCQHPSRAATRSKTVLHVLSEAIYEYTPTKQLRAVLMAAVGQSISAQHAGSMARRSI